MTSLRFESEVLEGSASSPGARLLHIAEIYRETVRAGAGEAGTGDVLQRLSEIGGRIESTNKVVALIAKSRASQLQKVQALLKMATGETAPPGPAAERAKGSLLKLAADPDVRTALSEDADSMRRLRQVVGPLPSAA